MMEAIVPTYDKERVIEQMRVSAVSSIVTKLLAREFALSENPEGMAREWLNLIELESDLAGFEGIPPEWSDFAAQEQRDSEVRLALRARAHATGALYNPDDFQKSWRIESDPSSSS